MTQGSLPQHEHSPPRETQAQFLRIHKPGTVLLISGFAGAGKTELIRTLARQFGPGVADVAVIVNEVTGASMRADLEKLSRDMAKIGITGCACCASNAQVLDWIDSFLKQGKKMVLVEQSGLSRTADLRFSIKSQHPVFVTALVNPRQTSALDRYVIPHVRASDAVLVTHVDPVKDLDGARGAAQLVKDITADLPVAPQLYFLMPQEDVPSPLWDLVFTTRIERAKGVFAKARTLLSGVVPPPGLSPAEELARREDVAQCREIEVLLYPGLTPEAIETALCGLKTRDGSRITNLIRAKGVLGGQDFQVVFENEKPLTTVQPLDHQCTAYNRRDHLFIRALDPRLEGAWRYVAQHLGTPDIDVAGAQAIGRLYPGKEALLTELREENRLPVLFGADRLLWELAEPLDSFQLIPDTERKKQLLHSVLTMVHRFLLTRLALSEVLRSPEAMQHPDHGEWTFNAFFVGTQVLVLPELHALIKSQPPLAALAAKLWQEEPVRRMLEGLCGMRVLAINGDTEIRDGEINLLRAYIEAGKLRKELSPDLLQRTSHHLSALAGRIANGSWSKALPKIQEALLGR